MIKISFVNPGDKVYINPTLSKKDELSEKLKSLNIYSTDEKTRVVNYRVNNHEDLTFILDKLKNAPFLENNNFCDCLDPTIFEVNPVRWEAHNLGDCGFPFTKCDNTEHQKMYCLDCGGLVKVAFCYHNTNSFSCDPEKGWWVDSGCGLPKKAYFEKLLLEEQMKANGKRSILYREYEQPSIEARNIMTIQLKDKENAFSSSLKVIAC